MANPTTIQFQTETVGGQSLGAQPAVPQMGVQGGGVAPAGPVRRGADWFDSVGGMTTDFGGNLPEFLNEAFAPALEASKNRKMWEGFTAAREGKQMKEIADEQPWYSKVFGPTNYEIGAQTFHVQKQVADMETDIIRRMPELRQLPPEAMAQEMSRMSEESKMGNGYADTLMQKTFMDRAGTIMDLHTKERSAWQQTELLKGNLEAGKAAASAYQSMSAAQAQLGGTTPNDPQVAAELAEAKINFANTLIPSQYQTDESIFAYYSALSNDLAKSGQFYALNTMLDAGMIQSLPIEQQGQLEQSIESARRQYAANIPLDDTLVQEKAQWQADFRNGFVSAAESTAHAHDINRRWEARTGDRKGIIDTAEGTSGAVTALDAFYSKLNQEENARRTAAAAASTDLEKEKLRMQQVTRDTDSWKTGNIGVLVDSGVTTKDNAEVSAVASFEADPKVALQSAVLAYGAQNHRFISEKVKSIVQQGIPADPDAEWTPSFHASYEMFKAMENQTIPQSDGTVDTMSGRNAAREYFGEKNVDLFRSYENGLRKRMDPENALSYAQTGLKDTPVNRGYLTKEQGEKLDAALNGPNWAMRLFTGQEKLVSKGVLRSSAMNLYQTIQRQNPDKSDEWVAKASVQAAQAKDVDVAGEYSWHRMPGQNPITAYADNVSPDIYGTALREYINKRTRKANVDVNDDTEFYMHRTSDKGGFPILHVWAQDKKGRLVNMTFEEGDFHTVQHEAEALRKSRGGTATQVRDTSMMHRGR